MSEKRTQVPYVIRWASKDELDSAKAHARALSIPFNTFVCRSVEMAKENFPVSAQDLKVSETAQQSREAFMEGSARPRARRGRPRRKARLVANAENDARPRTLADIMDEYEGPPLGEWSETDRAKVTEHLARLAAEMSPPASRPDVWHEAAKDLPKVKLTIEPFHGVTEDWKPGSGGRPGKAGPKPK